MIRPWRLSDTSQLIELCRAGAAEVYPQVEFDPEAIRRMALDFYNDKTGRRVCFVADSGTELVGSIAGTVQPYFFSKELLMVETGFFLKKGNRGSGSKLLSALEDQARRAGCRELVSFGPQRATAFYKRAGFNVDGVNARKVLQ